MKNININKSDYKTNKKDYSEASKLEGSDVIFNNLIWLTTEETALYLRKSANAIRILVFKGHLNARKFKRRLYFKKEELDTLLDTAFVTGGI